MQSTTEGIVALTQGETSFGVKVHRAARNELVTLHSQHASEANEDVAGAIYAHVMVGRTAVKVALTPGVVLQSVPMYAGDEMWVRCTRPGAFVVYGFTTPVR